MSGRPGVVVTTSGPACSTRCRGRHRLGGVAAGADALARRADRHRGPRPGPAARDQGRHAARWGGSSLEPPGVARPRRRPTAVTEAFAGVHRRAAAARCTSRSRSTCWSSPGPARPGRPRGRRPRPRPIPTPCGAPPRCSPGARPLIIAGGGAVDAAGRLTALAEALGAPVATTVNGKGVRRRGASAVGRRVDPAARAAAGRRRQRRAARDRQRTRRFRPLGRSRSRDRPSSAATSTRRSWTRTASPTTSCSAMRP